MKLRLVVAAEPTPGSSAATEQQQSPVDKARERFGRKFAYEPGNDFLRYPESVLDRWRRKAPWRDVNPNHKAKS